MNKGVLIFFPLFPLASKGLIVTPEYWFENYGGLAYLGDLLVAVAKRVL